MQPSAVGRPRGRGEDSLAIDGHVQGLNAREAAARLTFGKLAHELCRSRAYHALGFARLGDYTRERLGLSPREVESLAQVTTALAGLPAIAAVFARGELSWTRARLLAGIATQDDEVIWLGRARECSGAELATLARLRVETSAVDLTTRADLPFSVASPSSEARDALDQSLNLVEGEPAVRFHLRCPSRLRGLFYDTVELARRVAGGSLPIADAAEAIAAEALSGAPRNALEQHSPAAAQQSTTPAAAQITGVWGMPAKVHSLAATPIPASPRDLDARLRESAAALHAVDSEVGRMLIDIRERRLHRWLGFRSFADYVRDRLGVAPRTARALMAAERAASTCEALAAAYRTGKLSWLQTLTMAAVVTHASSDLASAWVARARRVTLRRLTDEVAWVLARRDAGVPGPHHPPPLDHHLQRDEEWQIGAPSEAPTAPGSPHARISSELVDAAITFTGPASIVALLHTAIAAFAVPPEPRWRSCERLLRHVQATWRSLPRHPDPVFERDGWRCAVPACSSRRNLHDHHVRFRSRGGDNRRTNRITVCAWHHLRAIHSGRVRGWGTAPRGIRWQLGLDRSGAGPLLEFLGDRYLDDAEVMADRLVHQRQMAARLAAWIPLDGNWTGRRTRTSSLEGQKCPRAPRDTRVALHVSRPAASLGPRPSSALAARRPIPPPMTSRYRR